MQLPPPSQGGLYVLVFSAVAWQDEERLQLLAELDTVSPAPFLGNCDVSCSCRCCDVMCAGVETQRGFDIFRS